MRSICIFRSVLSFLHFHLKAFILVLFQGSNFNNENSIFLSFTQKNPITPWYSSRKVVPAAPSLLLPTISLLLFCLLYMINCIIFYVHGLQIGCQKWKKPLNMIKIAQFRWQHLRAVSSSSFFLTNFTDSVYIWAFNKAILKPA